MPLATEVGLGPGHIVLDGDPAPPKRDTAPKFRPISVVTKQLMEVGRGPGHIVLNGDHHHHHHHQVCLINSWQTQHVYNVDRESKIAVR